MKMFVWEYLEGLTEAWHSDGGVVAVASSVADALAAIPNTNGSDRPDPEFVYDLDGEPEPRVFVFPNAGCC